MRPRVVAHRGVRNSYPENTLAGIEAALSLPGLLGVEFDVELSDAPVVLHQETMVPSPDSRAVVPAARNFTSRDWVSQYTAEQITRLDAGTWFDQKFSQLRVPRLAEVLGLNWHGTTAFVELKDPTFWGTKNQDWPRRMVSSVLPELKAFSKRASLDVISFNPEILRALHVELPKVPLTLALWTEWESRSAEAVTLATSIPAKTISIPDTLVLADNSWVDVLHRAGLTLAVYPVTPTRGEPEYARWTAESQRVTWAKLQSLGVDILVSDFPKETLAAIHDSGF